MIRNLTYRLLIHDLKSITGNTTEPSFRKIEDKTNLNLDNPEIDSLLNYMSTVLTNFETEPIDKYIDKISSLALAFGYDYESLLKNLNITLINPPSDKYKFEFVSEKPILSHFALSNFCDDLQTTLKQLQITDRQSQLDFYANLIKERNEALILKKESLKNYIQIIPELKNTKKIRDEIIMLTQEISRMNESYKKIKQKFENTKSPIKIIERATFPQNSK